MGREYIYGLMVENLMENGRIIKWKDRVDLLGQMEGNINNINYRKYNGNYVNDKKEGYGEFYWPDGRIYKGYWKDGK